MTVISSIISNCVFGLKITGAKNVVPKAFGSMWRYTDWAPDACWPNYKPSLDHHKHRRHKPKPFSEGIMKQTKMRVVDDSKIGQEAINMGRPPMVIQVYSLRHRARPHGSYGILGDIVKVAIMGETKKGIIVGSKVKQPHGIPTFDTNNIVLIADDGTPLGKNVTVPVPLQLKKILNDKTHYKKPEYNKMLKNVKKFV